MEWVIRGIMKALLFKDRRNTIHSLCPTKWACAPDNSVFVVTQEIAQLKQLLELFEEHLDAPSVFIQIRDTRYRPLSVLWNERHLGACDIKVDRMILTNQLLFHLYGTTVKIFYSASLIRAPDYVIHQYPGGSWEGPLYALHAMPPNIIFDRTDTDKSYAGFVLQGGATSARLLF